MVKFKTYYLLLASLIVCTGAFGQHAKVDSAAVPVDEAIDNLLRFADMEAGEQLIEDLFQHYADPLNFDGASLQEIASLPTISRLQAARIASILADSDEPLSSTQLKTALQVSDSHFQALLPFITWTTSAEELDVPEESFLSHTDVQWIQRHTRRLERARGYDVIDGERAYLGPPDRHYSRLRVRHPRAELNLTLDKAPGEPFSWELDRSSLYFPHYAGYLHLKDIGPFNELVIGDFTAGFGEGLSLSAARLGATGNDPFAPMSTGATGIRPYGSSMRNQAYRGLAASTTFSNAIELTGFVSSTSRDATVDTLQTSPEPIPITTGPSSSGYYRTDTERARRSQLSEHVMGAAVTYTSDRLSFGLVTHHTNYGAEIRLPDVPHRTHQFEGTSSTVFGIYSDVRLNTGQAFGEVSHSLYRGTAVTAGYFTRLSRYSSLMTALRYLPPHFASLHGHAFTSAGSSPRNEYGWFNGIRIQPHPDWVVDASVDHQRFPWLRHYFSLPTTGYESRISARYEPFRWLSTYLSYRFRSREERLDIQDDAGRVLSGVRARSSHSVRSQLSYQFNPAIRLQLRADARFSKQTTEDQAVGTLLYADLRLNPTSWLRLDQRFTLFDTDSYDARLYAYESDLLYSFNLPPLYGIGQRAYAMATIQPSSHIYLQFKYSVSRFENQNFIGSGWNEIKGNTLSEIRSQIRLRF